MKIHDLSPAPGSKKARTRVGRGIGSKGKTAGRGSKGQGARDTVPAWFEGGQTPLHRLTPKAKGFNNPFRVEYSPVNLDQLSATGEPAVDPEVLVAKGLVRKGTLVKVLARGELTAKIDVTAHAVSKAAEAAITAAGGTVTILPLPYKQGRPPVQGNQFANR